MLDIILEKEITRLVGKGVVDICREDGMFAISSCEGSICIKKEEGEKWLVSYVSWPSDTNIDCKDNKNKGYEQYIEMSSYLETMPFNKALETAFGFLITILPKEYNPNMNLN